jgi:methyltransferase (TIGR00027 family)
MIEDRPSELAAVAAFLRALEQLQPPDRRMLDDPYSLKLLPRWSWRWSAQSRLMAWLLNRARPGRLEHIVARGRFADELIRANADRVGLQVVLLGAGYDTSPYRLGPEVPGARFFEVDHPATQKAKRAALDKLAPPGRERVTFVPVNLEVNPLPPALTGAGFDPAQPSVVIWMGVSMFLTEAAIRGTLAALSGVMSDSSWLGFDYFSAAHAGMADDTDPRALRRDREAAQRLGEPVLFGIEPDKLGGLFGEYGFRLVENVTGDELTRRYTGNARRAVEFWLVASARRER